MLVFIDSNQYISDYWLSSASFRYLLHFIKNERHTLLLSRLVVQEVENKFGEQTAQARADALKVADRLAKLGAQGVKALADAQVPPLRMEERLRELVDMVVVDYDDVPHDLVVQRSLDRKRPFDAEGHDGYRDCLLWLSLMRFLGSSGRGQDCIFISNNASDFFEQAYKQKGAAKEDAAKPVARFHQHLADDIAGCGCKVEPYETIAAFVDTQVDKGRHAIDDDRHYELFEGFLTDESVAVLSHLEEAAYSKTVQSMLGALDQSLTVLNTEADVVEGMEDLDVHSSELIDGKVYVTCSYNLRIVGVDVFVPKSQLDEHHAAIAKLPCVWEVSDVGQYGAIRMVVRPYFTASFDFDPQDEECSGFSLQEMTLRTS